MSMRSEEIAERVRAVGADRVFWLTDANVQRLWGARIPDSMAVLAVAPGEGAKSLETAARVWRWLADGGATRRSLLVNFGGGSVCDLGGFCASTYMRGIRTVNAPTTLLAAADAAIGGKTALDFEGVKNMVGTFHMPLDVLVNPEYFGTLPRAELLSGYAEVVKMTLIGNAGLYGDLARGDAPGDAPGDAALLGRATEYAASAKREIVALDPHEKGLRRVLNFGHSIGHAYEAAAMRAGESVSHGRAVAWGMLDALRLSVIHAGLDPALPDGYRRDIAGRYYEPIPQVCRHAATLRDIMKSDKKCLAGGYIDFVLIEAPGAPVVKPLQIDDIFNSLKQYFD